MIAGKLKYKIDFLKPDSNKNNRTYSFEFSVMASIAWKSGQMNVVNDSIEYNLVIEIYTRTIYQPFTNDYHLMINNDEYTILSINRIDKDVKIMASKWK